MPPPLAATRRAVEALTSAPGGPTSADWEHRGRASGRSGRSQHTADQDAKLAALEAQVALLLAERDASRAALAEAQEDYSSLRLMTSALKSELHGLRETLDRYGKELRSEATTPIISVKEEMQALRHENIALKAQLGVFERELGSCSAARQEQAQQLQDLTVLRAQLGFVQTAADRADLSAADQARQFSDMRTELANLQQRHASLTSGNAAEHASHHHAVAALRAAVEANAVAIETLQSSVGSLQASERESNTTGEKLKKQTRRQELQIQQQSEAFEQRATELRALIKTVAEQLKAAQIEEISSGVNALAEIIKFTNRNRSSHTLSNVLDAI